MNWLKILASSLFLFFSQNIYSQQRWVNVDTTFGNLSNSIHVFRSTDSIEGLPSIAYYVRVKLADKNLLFTTGTSYQRRLTPAQFFEKNQRPIIVVNGTFFDFGSNRNLNILIREGKLISYNVHSQGLRGKDTGLYYKTTRSAIGIFRNRKADVAWTFSDSNATNVIAFQKKPTPWKDSINFASRKEFEHRYGNKGKKWKVRTAIGGGPVLVQDGVPMITNNEERMFAGNARNDRHPRTAMGYTKDGSLIILVVEGRNKGQAEGASLLHLASMLVELGCMEALNLDGGGSSCLLINGKPTIKPSDKEGQRPVPGVFLISENRKSTN